MDVRGAVVLDRDSLSDEASTRLVEDFTADFEVDEAPTVEFAVVLLPMVPLLVLEVCDGVGEAVPVTSEPVAVALSPSPSLSPLPLLSPSPSASPSSSAGSESSALSMIGCVIRVGRGMFISSSEALASYLVALSNAHDGPAVAVGVSVEVVVVGCALQPEDDMHVVV